MLIIRLLVPTFLACAFNSAAAKDIYNIPVGVRISYGSGSAICTEAANILRRLPRIKFLNESWREDFGSTKWENNSYTSKDAEGKPREIEYEFRFVDINNDGRKDVILKQTGSFRGDIWDWLYVASASEFHALRTDQEAGKAFEKIPPLNPRNVVVFTNKHEGVPTEMQIWRRGSKNYLIMKELPFSSGRNKSWASVYVAELRGRINTRLDRLGDPRLFFNMICRIKEM
jgi:hypothetical protein